MADDIKALTARIDVLERAVRDMKALARGSKGDDGRDGKDGKDGRDGKTIRASESASAAPVVNVHNARPLPTAWLFDTDDKGRMMALPMEIPRNER